MIFKKLSVILVCSSLFGCSLSNSKTEIGQVNVPTSTFVSASVVSVATLIPTLPPPINTSTPIPSRTAVPEKTATTVIMTATALPSLKTPSLILPAAGASFFGNTNPVFSWVSAGNLGTFDYYQFQIQHSLGWDVICTKNTSAQARSYVPSLGPFQWTVNVVRLSSAISNGTACSGSIVASAGEVRRLSWSANTSGGQSSSEGARTPTPAGGSSAPSNPPTAVPCVPGPRVKC